MEVRLAHNVADAPNDDHAAETGEDSGGCCGGERGPHVPATAGRRTPVSQKPRRGHLHSDSSFFTSTGLGGRGGDLLLVMGLV